jgi:hypothetical protein
MPFRLADGNHYFEAVEFYLTLDVEIFENHLALCPTCAAKWRHANAAAPSSITASIMEAESPELEVVLAGSMAQVKFVHLHFQDVRTIIGSAQELLGARMEVSPGSDAFAAPSV